MVTNRKKWALGGGVLLLCVVLFLGWAILWPSYERAKRFSDELGDEPYIYQSPETPDN